MEIRRTLVPLVILLALAIAYFAGVTRQGSRGGDAYAGSPVHQAVSSGNYMTSSADGNTLFVWRLGMGGPSAVSAYEFVRSRSADGRVEGLVVVVHASVPTNPPAGK